MKKVSKVVLFSALVGLLCMSVYALPLGGIVNKAISDAISSRWRNQRPDWSKGEWEAIDFNSDGTCNCWDGSAKGLDGKWTGDLKNGGKVSVTCGSKTQSGTVTKQGLTLVVTLGTWGTFKKE